MYHKVVAVWGKEMDFLALCLRLVDHIGQFAHGSMVRHATLRGQICNAVNLAEPYDILNVNVVAYQVLVVVVYVNDSNQSFPVLSKIIQEAAVLSEFVYVGRVVDR